MMRTPSVHNRNGRELKIEMTPMIDVVFLLLVFFVWTASFRMVELSLPAEVSIQSGSQESDLQDPPPEELDFENIVVRITGDAQSVSWSMNEQEIPSLNALRDRLRTISRIKQDAPVILHPDKSVRYGEVMRVYDISRVVGFESVQIAANIE